MLKALFLCWSNFCFLPLLFIVVKTAIAVFVGSYSNSLSLLLRMPSCNDQFFCVVSNGQSYLPYWVSC